MRSSRNQFRRKIISLYHGEYYFHIFNIFYTDYLCTQITENGKDYVNELYLVHIMFSYIYIYTYIFFFFSHQTTNLKTLSILYDETKIVSSCKFVYLCPQINLSFTILPIVKKKKINQIKNKSLCY